MERNPKLSVLSCQSRGPAFANSALHINLFDK